MTELTRRSVLAAAGASLALAGCLTEAPDGSGGEKPTERTTVRSTPTGRPGTEAGPGETTPGTTGDWIERASNTPNPDHGVSIENEAAVSATLRVAVVREAAGKAVFETTRRVGPGAEVAVFNLEQADPEGVERFEVCAELVASGGTETGSATATTSEEPATTDESATGTGASTETTTAETDRRDCATIATNECYGSAYARIAEDGAVQLVYAIC